MFRKQGCSSSFLAVLGDRDSIGSVRGSGTDYSDAGFKSVAALRREHRRGGFHPELSPNFAIQTLSGMV